MNLFIRKEMLDICLLGVEWSGEQKQVVLYNSHATIHDTAINHWQMRHLPIQTSLGSCSLLARHKHSWWRERIDICSRLPFPGSSLVYKKEENQIKIWDSNQIQKTKDTKQDRIHIGNIHLPDLPEPENRVLVLRAGAGVAKTGIGIGWLFSNRVFGVAGESNSLRARTPLYGGDMLSLTFERRNLGFRGLVIWMLMPRPSSLPDESRRSDDIVVWLSVDVEASKSSSSLKGKWSRWTILRQLSSISISRSMTNVNTD